MLDRGVGEPEQNPALTAERLQIQIGDQFLLDAIVRPRAILCTTPSSRSTRLSVISVIRDQQTHARSVSRTSRGSRVATTDAPPPPVRATAPLASRPPRRTGLVCGQADREHPLEPGDLAEQRLKPGRAWIRTQLREQPRAATCRLGRLVFSDELLQPCHSLSVKSRERGGTEPLIRQSSCAAKQPGDPPRRLKTLLPAAPEQRCTLALLADLARARYVGQPARQPLLVRARRLAKSGRFSDLRAVILDRAPRPLVLRKLARLDLHQAGDVAHRGRRQLCGVCREAALQFKELQQQREPETGRASLVRDQLPVAVDQRPAVDQLLGLPFATHSTNPR